MSHSEEFQRKRIEMRRLAILLYLEEEPDKRMSISLLHRAIQASIQMVDRDVIVADGQFLAAAGLVTMRHDGDVPALTLTTWGREVAAGTRKVRGVQPPPLD